MPVSGEVAVPHKEEGRRRVGWKQWTQERSKRHLSGPIMRRFDYFSHSANLIKSECASYGWAPFSNRGLCWIHSNLALCRQGLRLTHILMVHFQKIKSRLTKSQKIMETLSSVWMPLVEEGESPGKVSIFQTFNHVSVNMHYSLLTSIIALVWATFCHFYWEFSQGQCLINLLISEDKSRPLGSDSFPREGHPSSPHSDQHPITPTLGHKQITSADEVSQQEASEVPIKCLWKRCENLLLKCDFTLLWTQEHMENILMHTSQDTWLFGLKCKDIRL